MSTLIIVIGASLVDALYEAVAIRAKAAKAARKLPRRARQYKFT